MFVLFSARDHLLCKVCNLRQIVQTLSELCTFKQSDFLEICAKSLENWQKCVLSIQIKLLIILGKGCTQVLLNCVYNAYVISELHRITLKKKKKKKKKLSNSLDQYSQMQIFKFEHICKYLI